MNKVLEDYPKNIKSKPITKADSLHAEIYDKCQSLFGGIYNVIDLGIEDKEKASIMKDLIGSIIVRARDGCHKAVIDILGNN